MEFKLKQGIKRRPLGQEVRLLLKRMIVSGELAPGQRLVEEQLAAQVGISRTPVREALHRLEQDGLLAKRARGGYVVRPLTPEEVAEAMGVRAILEAYAAELAAQRATEQDLAALRQNLAEFVAALNQKDEVALVDTNNQFHQLLHQATHSALLNRLLGELEDTLERISRALYSNMAAGSWSSKDHSAILGAIEARDADQAAQLAKAHVEHGGQWLVSAMQRQEVEL